MSAALGKLSNRELRQRERASVKSSRAPRLKKTHCVRGHRRIPETVGRRHACLICAKELSKKRAERDRIRRAKWRKKFGYFRIYIITNRDTGKAYVGCTTYSLHQRCRWHKNAKTLVGKALRENPGAFKARVLSVALNERAAAAVERFWIGELGTLHPRGYNTTESGQGGVRKGSPGRKQSPEERAHRGGQKRGLETRQRMREARRRWLAAHPPRKAPTTIASLPRTRLTDVTK